MFGLPPRDRRRHVLLVVGALVVVASCLSVVRVGGLGAGRAGATDPVTRPADPVPGQYIVVLDADQADRTRAVGLELADEVDGRVVDSFDDTIPAFVARMDDEDAQALANDERVAGVYQDGYVRVEATQSPAPWAPDRVDQAALPLDGTYSTTFDGTGVHAYVIDTGIRISHQDFGGRASVGVDILGGNGLDCHGHGTFVAGLIAGAYAGVAKAAEVVSVRSMDCNGVGTYSQVIAAVNWVTANAQRPAVVNMSLGGPAFAPLDAAVSSSIAAGIPYVTAAGNDGVDACGVSPARVGPAITVGATDQNDVRPWWSNRGACLDTFAPGVDVVSTSSTGDNQYAIGSGTSFAAPVVTGIVAHMLQRHHDLSPATASSLLVRAAPTGLVGDPGPGSPNRLARTFEALSAHPGVVIAVAGDDDWSPATEAIMGTDPRVADYDPLNFSIRSDGSVR
jgi:subtilisin family serine protease